MVTFSDSSVERYSMKPGIIASGLCLSVAVLVATTTIADDQIAIAGIEVHAAVDLVAENENAIILDVRMPIEYETSHISGSVNVDVQDESFRDMAAALDPAKTYIVHCTKNPAGGRSSRALETLQELGFENLYSLDGGYIAWKDADLPLTESSD
jgi:rhodanese-related sulfurtransferase